MNLRPLLLLCIVSIIGSPQSPQRARGLGVPFDGNTGPLNAITDVKGVEVGNATLIRGEGKLIVGQGPVRTGVTVIFPRGRGDGDPVYAGWFTQNGNGEMTGTTWVEESGFLEGPVAITNTHSVGMGARLHHRLARSNRPVQPSTMGAAGGCRNLRRLLK